jgi:hypothetical protein
MLRTLASPIPAVIVRDRRGESQYRPNPCRGEAHAIREVFKSKPLRQGYGIPDLITFAWSTQQNPATVLSLEALRQKLQRQQFTAFELKLRDWRKGFCQGSNLMAALAPAT